MEDASFCLSIASKINWKLNITLKRLYFFTDLLFSYYHAFLFTLCNLRSRIVLIASLVLSNMLYHLGIISCPSFSVRHEM